MILALVLTITSLGLIGVTQIVMAILKALDSLS